MPKDMPKDIGEQMVTLLRDCRLESDVRKCMDGLRKQMPTKTFYNAIGETYKYLKNGDSQQLKRIADYLKTVYGGGRYDYYFGGQMSQKQTPENKAAEMKYVFKSDKKDELDEIINFKNVVDFALKECNQYNEAKSIYDMLSELLDGVKDQRWQTAKKDLKARMHKLSSGVIVEHADEFVAEKNVGYEVGYVEKDGTGIMIKE